MLSPEHLIPKYSKHTFFIALLVFLLSQPSAYADDSCQLRHIQCTNPSFGSCNNGFGAGQCTQTGDGATNDTCSMTVFPNGFSGSYKDRTVNCLEEDGCEAVNCPAECMHDPSVDCQCVAEWGLDSSIRFEPAFCLPGSIDGSCHQQYFKCTTVNFNFCSQGYGAGLCINQEPPGRNCTINYYPDSFNKTVNSSHLSCENPAGCEGIECTDNCHGSWHLNNKTEVAPGNCAANTGHLCQLKYLHCDDVQFDWCREGYGKGNCQNPASNENCTLTVLPDHQNDQCMSPGGCEKLSCDACKANWMINNRISVTPEGCASGQNDGTCKINNFQCDHPVLDFCQHGYGVGHCQNPASGERCTLVALPNNQNEQCSNPDGCEKLSCDSCKAHWMIGNRTSIKPENCINGLNDGSCQLRFFQCSNLKLDFCQNGYGSGRCDNDHQQTDCTVWFVPNQFSFKDSDDNIQVCHQSSGCEWLNCENSCNGYGYQGWQETTPGNCLATKSKPCQLQYFACDDQKFDSCKGGYGTGTCSNADTVESCSITVYPNGWRASSTDPVLCSNKQGCEQIQCPEGCDDYCDCAGQWQVYGKTNVYPSDCLDYHNPSSSLSVALGLGITGGVILMVSASTLTAIFAICACKHPGRRTYQQLN